MMQDYDVIAYEQIECIDYGKKQKWIASGPGHGTYWVASGPGHGTYRPYSSVENK
jgi:hypothetical protein